MTTRRTLLAAPGAALLKGVTKAAQTDFLTAARGVLVRCLGGRGDDFHLSRIPFEGRRSVFEVSASGGRVEIKGSTPVAALHGFYRYLRDNHLGMITWGGKRIEAPARWPDAQRQRVVCPYIHTQYFNPCTFGYSLPFWNWELWERELDWMALHGINMPLALDGQEAIWQKVWTSFGVTGAEWDRFTTGPAHLPWHRMGNINRFDGPLPQGWIDRKMQLQKRILGRMVELGMTPIVPGFAGHVPEAMRRLNPRAQISTMLWDASPGLPRDTCTFLLHPSERELFREIGRRFVQTYKQEYGVGGYYLADPFNELKVPVSEERRYQDLAQFASNIYAGIQAGDPDGVWVMQGWQYANDPKFWDKKSTQAFLSGVPGDRILTIDYAGDMDSVHELEYHNAPDAWRRLDGFYGKPWIGGMAHTFGGNNNVKGNLRLIASKPAAILANPAKGNLVGWGIDMEGIETNEIVYELMTDIGWRSTRVDLEQWIPSYCKARYGGFPDAMRQAWSLLLETAYSDGVWKTRHAFQSHPSLDPRPQHVDTSARFQQAVEAFVSCADDFRGSVLYRNDLIELVVQAVGGKVDRRLAAACKSHTEGRPKDRDAQSKQALDMLRRVDGLLHVREDRRLDTWVHDARSWAASQDEAAYYDSNARRLITYWGWRELEDYASRLWSGLVGDFYRARWEIFFADLASGRTDSIDVWTQGWLSAPYRSGVRAVVDDACAESLRMIEDCSEWT